MKIHNFDLPQHDVLEGRVIRCSNNEGLYIVGCQMPEDDFSELIFRISVPEFLDVKAMI